MSGKFDSYLTNYYDHTATKRALEWNACCVPYHHGKHFPSDKSAAVLEIGPGYGHLLAILVKRYGYAKVKAVDLSPEVVKYCNQLFPGTTDLTSDTTAYLQEHVEEFDLILMLHVLEHVTKDETIAFLQAVRGALKPHGKLVVEVPNTDNPIVGLSKRNDDFTHTVGYNQQSLMQVLRMAGFSQVVSYGCRIVPKNLARTFQRLGQSGIELLYWLPRRIYGQRSILASLLGACATK